MRIGFIGAGNMAQAIIGGVLKEGVAAPEEVRACDPAQASREAVEALGVQALSDNAAVAAWADVVVLAVKPQFLSDAIAQVREAVQTQALVVSIAAGKTLAWIEGEFGRPLRLVRVMPNTPALVGRGVSGMCANAAASDADRCGNAPAC